MAIKKSKKIVKHKKIRKFEREEPAEEFKKNPPELEKISEPEKGFEEISSNLVLDKKPKAPVLEIIEKLPQNANLEEQLKEVKTEELKDKKEFKIYNPETYKAPQDYTLSNTYQDFSRQFQHSQPVPDRFQVRDRFIPSSVNTHVRFKDWEKPREDYPETIDPSKRQSYESDIKRTIQGM
jgi:hypothetical protein